MSKFGCGTCGCCLFDFDAKGLEVKFYEAGRQVEGWWRHTLLGKQGKATVKSVNKKILTQYVRVK